MIPRIAILLINYRNAEDTVSCLESIEKTEHAGLTVFIMDNASWDGSAENIAAYLKTSPLKTSLILNPENLGYAGGMNIGMRKALEEGADFLVVMNNDVRVAADFGSQLEKACMDHPAAVVAGSILNEHTGKAAHNVGRISRYTLRIDFLFDGFEKGGIDFVSGCLMIIPATILARVGFLDERYFMYAEDLDYCLRLRKMGIPVVYFPDLVIWHKLNASVQKAGLAKEYYAVRNQTRVSMAHGGWGHRILYVLSSLVVLLAKVREPRMFPVLFRAMRDGLLNRMGRL